MKYRKCVIYGAGIFCNRLFASKLINIQDVDYIVDRDMDKRGKKICGVTIFSPSKLKDGRYNWVIITTRPGHYFDVYNLLNQKMQIPSEKIVFYNPEDEIILNDKEVIGYSFRFHLYEHFKREYLMGNLLFEATMNNEFDCYDRVLVCGELNDDIFQYICDFFDCFLESKIIIRENLDGNMVIEKTDKLLFMTKYSAKCVNRLHDKYQYEPEQLLVLPIP